MSAVPAHTPGPWVVFHADENGPNDVLPAGRPGCIASNIEKLSDARMIAAAPHMLAALHEIADDDPCPARNIARAAIAKIESRS